MTTICPRCRQPGELHSYKGPRPGKHYAGFVRHPESVCQLTREQCADAEKSALAPEVLLTWMSPELRDEIQYRIDAFGEDDPADGGVTLANIGTALEDLETSDDSRFRTEVRALYIRTGVYVPMSDAEVRNAVVSAGRKPYEFKLQGVAYRFGSHFHR